MLRALPTRGFVPVLEDLGLAPARVRAPEAAAAAGDAAAAILCGIDGDPSASMDELAALAARAPGAQDHLLVFLEGARSERELARWRDALWPAQHLTAIYRLGHGGMFCRSLQGERALGHGTGMRGELLSLRPRAAVFERSAVASKFDQNAAGWNGTPGRPGYAHFRWMRRYVGSYAQARGARRILDFGCGAGWVGIEAALLAPGAELCAFDPSPEMVALATANARASAIARFEGRVGFGEEPPFPAPGEAGFDLVLSSGVISFAADPERFLDGLLRTVAPGGTLVIGDLNPESRGMRRRRSERPLLPLRELNAPTRAAVEAALARRGFALEASSGYQLTSPVPELAAWSERRLGGLLDAPLLAWNRARAGGPSSAAFDSWVLRCSRAAATSA